MVLTVIFLSPICNKFALEFGWKNGIAQNIRKMGYIKKMMGFFIKQNIKIFKIGKLANLQ